MKMFLTFVGIIVLAAGIISYMVFHGQELDASSKAYVEENIPPIMSTWSKDELFKRSSPRLQKGINENSKDIDKLFQIYSQLGAMKSLDEVEGETHFSISTTPSKNTTTASYTATGRFENSDAQITVNLIQLSDQWRIHSFSVTSPLF